MVNKQNTIKNNTKKAAKGLILLKGKYLLMLRSAEEETLPSVWDIPGGGVKEGETLLEALIREIKEEARIDISSCKIMPIKKWHLRNGKNKVSGTDFLCIIKKSQKIKLSPEHACAKWFTGKEIMNNKEMPDWLKKTVSLAALKKIKLYERLH